MANGCMLPEEIIHSIFLRVPTETLLRLKCLSKYWNRVISDPKFMKSRSRRMILPPVLPLHAIDNSIQGNDMCHSMVKLHCPFLNLFDEVEYIVGTFNGIVLLVIRKENRLNEMILYNPVSTAFKVVPHPQGSHFTNHYVYGFGYGTTLDDLKIVRIAVSGIHSYDIFSLKNESWSSRSKLIGKYHFYHYSGTFVNGFLYWVAGKESHWPLIVALDIKEKVFSEILIPSGCKWRRLGTFNGRLCMICIQANDVELWVMNEHGFGKSWLRKCSSDRASLGGYDNLVCVLDDGKLLCLNYKSQKLIVFDMFKESYKEVNTLISFGELGKLGGIEYVESLASPSDMLSV
ncbi:F-box domain-containing protein [Artemisia annua]|uniref:F-box domain-containing protein n=1 Tax=Artemisia annua TaxID=35608 RepID=A0A2U1MAH7_ARTAN|nr:F-box domain-containing protein [Artemisia annua]